MDLRSADSGVPDDWRAACEGALSRSSEVRSTLFGRYFRRFPGAVGTLIVTAILITVLTTSDSRTVETFVADVGEMNPIPLPDGSVVTLNTDTVVRMSHESNILHFELLRGEVLFDMAANPNRHLLVSAADVSLTEAGTTFAVRMVGSDSVWVTVESGAVFLVSAHTPRTLISKNEQVALTRHDHAEFLHTAYLKSEDVKDQLAWRAGEIVFKNATLAAAAQEFSRYSRKVRIEVHGQAAAVQVGGAFSANDPLTFAQSVVFLNPEVSLEVDKRNADRRIVRLSSIAAARP
jgi:transmembrane sensor